MTDFLDGQAQLLATARAHARPLDAGEIAALGVSQAYAVQGRLARLARAAGREQIGWKVGVTSPAAMAAYGAAEPMAGRVFDDGLLETGTALDPARTCSPRIEGEILLEIGTPPPPDGTDAVLLASLASVRAAIEVADSRIRGWPTAVAQAIADAACGGWLVVGEEVSARAQDLAAAEMILTADGTPVSQGRGVDCFGGPLASYRWFLQKAAQERWTIEPGQLLLTGALGPPVPMLPGTDYSVAVGGLGTVSICFKSTKGE